MNGTQKDIQRRRPLRQAGQSATERYAELQGDITALLELIHDEVGIHSKKAAEDPRNWGMVGDLGHIRETLKTVLAFLIVPDTNNCEDEAGRVIESRLKDLRKAKQS